uniref:Uncharacterized protein n=1 Tax=Anguilla anguilla TaxID=7936 RepID=A0A0E9UP12_ANGAN
MVSIWYVCFCETAHTGEKGWGWLGALPLTKASELDLEIVGIRQ